MKNSFFIAALAAAVLCLSYSLAKLLFFYPKIRIPLLVISFILLILSLIAMYPTETGTITMMTLFVLASGIQDARVPIGIKIVFSLVLISILAGIVYVAARVFTNWFELIKEPTLSPQNTE